MSTFNYIYKSSGIDSQNFTTTSTTGSSSLYGQETNSNFIGPYVNGDEDEGIVIQTDKKYGKYARMRTRTDITQFTSSMSSFQVTSYLNINTQTSYSSTYEALSTLTRKSVTYTNGRYETYTYETTKKTVSFTTLTTSHQNTTVTTTKENYIYSSYYSSGTTTTQLSTSVITSDNWQEDYCLLPFTTNPDYCPYYVPGQSEEFYGTDGGQTIVEVPPQFLGPHFVLSDGHTYHFGGFYTANSYMYSTTGTRYESKKVTTGTSYETRDVTTATHYDTRSSTYYTYYREETRTATITYDTTTCTYYKYLERRNGLIRNSQTQNYTINLYLASVSGATTAKVQTAPDAYITTNKSFTSDQESGWMEYGYSFIWSESRFTDMAENNDILTKSHTFYRGNSTIFTSEFYQGSKTYTYRLDTDGQSMVEDNPFYLTQGAIILSTGDNNNKNYSRANLARKDDINYEWYSAKTAEGQSATHSANTATNPYWYHFNSNKLIFTTIESNANSQPFGPNANQALILVNMYTGSTPITPQQFAAMSQLIFTSTSKFTESKSKASQLTTNAAYSTMMSSDSFTLALTNDTRYFNSVSHSGVISTLIPGNTISAYEGTQILTLRSTTSSRYYSSTIYGNILSVYTEYAPFYNTNTTSSNADEGRRVFDSKHAYRMPYYQSMQFMFSSYTNTFFDIRKGTITTLDGDYIHPTSKTTTFWFYIDATGTERYEDLYVGYDNLYNKTTDVKNLVYPYFEGGRGQRLTYYSKEVFTYKSGANVSTNNSRFVGYMHKYDEYQYDRFGMLLAEPFGMEAWAVPFVSSSTIMSNGQVTYTYYTATNTKKDQKMETRYYRQNIFVQTTLRASDLIKDIQRRMVASYPDMTNARSTSIFWTRTSNTAGGQKTVTYIPIEFESVAATDIYYASMSLTTTQTSERPYRTTTSTGYETRTSTSRTRYDSVNSTLATDYLTTNQATKTLYDVTYVAIPTTYTYNFTSNSSSINP